MIMTIKQSSTNMAKNIFLILCIFLSFKLSAQNGRSETVSFLMDEFSSNLLKTNDDFYFSGNHDYYLINKSPLAHFSEYRSIYSADPNDIITYRVLYNPPRPYGWEGVSEKQYIATWVLFDNRLYLCRVEIHGERKDDKFLYPPMEKLVRKTFSKKNISNIDIPDPFYGLMPAKWFTDTLFIKKANPLENPLPANEWQVKPYQRLIFKKGKLISTETVANKTWIESVTFD